MKNIKNVLVALDLSEIDTKLIEYASFLAEKLSLEKVYFVHNIKKYEISELFAEQLKDINLDGLITEEIEDKLKNHFSATSETEILISEDHYTESLINYVANKYLIDLLIVGNKDHQTGTGVIPDKLLRLMKCDILAIPKNASEKLENIWIGTDFSKESRKSLQLGRFLKDKLQAQLTAAHVFNVPIQFSPYLDKEEMLPKIEKHTREKFSKFLSKNNEDLMETRIIRGRDSSVSTRLLEESMKNKADLLVVSDKGGNIFSSLLVGSVTDELFDSDLPLPLWVCK
ncbi:MAG: universal stress protein [Gramella sp.]|nr:universal stress protein [Christiangramia sp.]|tara:strand:- start:518 stop:1372 length:855 start_codon:yes stop_codon:yes gene_type:complete